MFVSKAAQYNGASNHFVALGLGITFDKLPFELKGQRSLIDVPANLYVTPQSLGEHVGNATTRFNDLNGITRASYYVTSQIHIPKTALGILLRYYGLPDRGGVPLYLYYENASKEHTTWLMTHSIKQARLKASEFAYPSNYKIARSENELLPYDGVRVDDIIGAGSNAKH